MTSSGRVLVTGATGCVGQAVVAAARGRGMSVRGLARHRPATGWPSDAELELADVRHADAVARAIEGCATVVHLAGWVHRTPHGRDDLTELNSSIVGGARVVATAARHASARLLLVSSIAVLGPDTPYGRAKLEAERVAREICPDAVIIRPAVVYGPHDRGSVARLIRAIDRRLGVVVGDGSNRKSLVHVDNLADRLLELVRRTELGGTWVAADDPAPTQGEIVIEIARSLGRRAPPRVPRRAATAVATAIDAVARTQWRDRVEKLARTTEHPGFELDQALGYSPQVQWPTGIRAQVQRWTSR